MATNRALNLNQFQTSHVQTLQDRTAPYTKTAKLLVEGNSLLSSVYVRSLTGSPTLDVKYFETTSGIEGEERRDLEAEHPTITGADARPDTRLVTPFHNNLYCEIIVGGTGTIEFGVYVTVVASFASLIDASLKFDGTTFVPTNDKGLPAMCVDEDTNTLNFLRCKNGKLGIDGGFTITARLFATTTLAYGAAAFTLISHTPSAEISVQQILVGGDGSGEFTVKINSVIWGVFRNSWNDRQVLIPMGGKVLTDSDTIVIEVENISSAMSGSCKYEAFIYTG